MGPIVVLVLRLCVPWLILKYPLGGAVLAWICDALDVVLIDAIGMGMFPELDAFYNANYHILDKYFDTYFLLFEVIVASRWKEKLARNTAIWLFLWRFIGFVAFEITHIRPILFLAPNLFNNFYGFYLITRKFKKNWEFGTKKRLFTILALLYIPKFFQEYFLHIRQIQPWTWVKNNLL